MLSVEEWELPVLGPTEVLNLVFQLLNNSDIQVLIKTLYAPIHPSDINMIEGVYMYNPTPPAVPGGEGVLSS